MSHLLRMKCDARSMYILNSFPWHLYPWWAISYASLPNPDPGTSTETDERSLGNNSENDTTIPLKAHTLFSANSLRSSSIIGP